VFNGHSDECSLLQGSEFGDRVEWADSCRQGGLPVEARKIASLGTHPPSGVAFHSNKPRSPITCLPRLGASYWSKGHSPGGEAGYRTRLSTVNTALGLHLFPRAALMTVTSPPSPGTTRAAGMPDMARVSFSL
jgi:hypothetical protein